MNLLARNETRDLVHFLGERFCDVVQRHDARQHTVRGYDGHAPHTLAAHSLHRVENILRFFGGDQLLPHDIAHRDRAWAELRGDHAQHDIPIGHDSERYAAVAVLSSDDDIADVVLPHEPRGYYHGGLGSGANDVTCADLSDLHDAFLDFANARAGAGLTTRMVATQALAQLTQVNVVHAPFTRYRLAVVDLTQAPRDESVHDTCTGIVHRDASPPTGESNAMQSAGSDLARHRLQTAVLRPRIDPARLGAQSTAELEPVARLIGQERAVDAVRFGISMRRPGYNLFVLGPTGLGKHTLLRGFLNAEASHVPTPSDWCYVHNFVAPYRPLAIALPPGGGAKFRDAMRKLAEEALAAITAIFESKEFRSRFEELADEFNERERKAFQALGEEAQQQNIALLHTPAGFAFAPMRDGAVINPDEYEKLPEAERSQIARTIAVLQEHLQRIIRQVPQWGRERRNRIMALRKEFTTLAVDHLITELEAEYASEPAVLGHLTSVRADLIGNAAQTRRAQDGSPEGGEAAPEQPPPWLRRYQVNLLVGHDSKPGAPVVIEDNPTYQDLIGRVEYASQFGALITDLTLIKPGALHRVNGGYLMIDAHKLLMQPYAWDALKRALVAREIRIGSIGQALGLISTVSLDPQSIPLDVKVVLFGERHLYYLLYDLDPEFRELFKVAADFEEHVPLSDGTLRLYARLIATVASNERMRAFDAHACARILEHIVRLAGDNTKLSTYMQSLADLMREADHMAHAAGEATVNAASVERAIDAQQRRADRVKLRTQESILEGVQLIDTRGARGSGE